MRRLMPSKIPLPYLHGQGRCKVLMFILILRTIDTLTVASPILHLSTLPELEKLLPRRLFPELYAEEFGLDLRDRDLQETCTRFERWQRPLEGSMPADVQPLRERALDDAVLDTTEIVVLYAATALVNLKDLLELYQDLETHRLPDLRFIFYTREPWNLKRRAADFYTVVASYVQIVNFYGCALEAEAEEDYIDEDPLNFQFVESDLMGILASVYLVLTPREISNIATLTLNQNVTTAEDYMKEADRHSVRKFLRAHLVWELREFLVKIMDDDYWQSNEKETSGKSYGTDYSYPENLRFKINQIPLLYKRPRMGKSNIFSPFYSNEVGT